MAYFHRNRCARCLIFRLFCWYFGEIYLEQQPVWEFIGQISVECQWLFIRGKGQRHCYFRLNLLLFSYLLLIHSSAFSLSADDKIIMTNFIPFQRIQLPAGKILFKKGEHYNNFFELVSGDITVLIGQMKMTISNPIIIGDYQLLENIEYRVSTLKTQSKCIFKVYDVAHYFKMSLYFKQITKAFDRFNFRSKMLNYWVKKLFFIDKNKRGDKVGNQNSVGVVLSGSYRIDKDIPIVRMKAKNLQLLKKFEICLLSCGEIFEGSLICESIVGIVGICPSLYLQQFLQKFQEFKKVIQITNFKSEIHQGMAKDIATQCSKKSKLYQNLVPLPLKQYVKIGNSIDIKSNSKQSISIRSPRLTQDVFQVENSISEFLHKQLRRQISLSLKRKDVSPKLKGHIKSQQLKKPKKQVTLDIENPMFVNLDGIKIMKRLKLQHQSQKKGKQKTVPFFASQRKRNLPALKSNRVKTEGDDKSHLQPYFKLLKLQ